MIFHSFLASKSPYHTVEISPSQSSKDRDKKLERNGRSVDQPNATIIEKVNVPSVSPMITTSEPKSHSGFIFLCNSSTKLECYQYRVFGLPLGKKEVVEEIKPGAKLFLFDFQLKLLYGIYEATSTGKMNLEPAAFGGKFPAQVKFRIFKECLPLPERVLRNIIEENYTGHKFKQELSRIQVKNLLSSFRPLTASSSSQPAPLALANVSRSRAMGGSLSYSGDMRYNNRVPTSVKPQHISNMNVFLHGYQRTSAVNLTSDLQSLASAISYSVASSQQSAFIEGVAHGVQEPSYSSYPTGNKSDMSFQVTDFERQFYQLPLQREAVHQENVFAYNQEAPTLYNTSAEMQYVASAPSYTSNPAASSYTSIPAASSYTSNLSASLPSQYPAYQYYNAVVYNSNPAALPSSQHPAYQNYNAVAYNSNPAAPSLSQYATYQDYNEIAYDPSAIQPHAEISQGNDPASACYSYRAENQLSR